MSTDLEERLAEYRPTLDAAIDAWSPHHAPAAESRSGRSLLAVAAAVLAVVGGVVGVAVVRSGSSGSPATDGPPPDPVPAPPATTVAITVPDPATTVALPVPIVPPVPSTVPVPADPPILAFGDSVMLGAAQNLAELGVTVIAHESAYFQAATPYVQQMAEAGEFGEAMVVHLGTNGPPSAETLDAFFEALASVPKIVVLTAYADRSWIDATNVELHAAAARFPNIELLDWATLAEQCPGECFLEDGYHLAPDGRTYYADLIAAALSLE